MSVLASPAISEVADPPIPGTPQIIRNGDFINGSSGWTSSPQGQVVDGSYCMRVPKGKGFNGSYLRTTYDFLETKVRCEFPISTTNECSIKMTRTMFIL